jgi:hypothetical protein
LKQLLEQAKKTVVFLGEGDEHGRPVPYATGFLISVNNMYHLLTARHVIVDIKTGELQDDELCVFFNLKEDKGIGTRRIAEMKAKFGVDWIFHSQAEVDIAILPVGLDSEKDDVKVMPNDLFLTSDSLFELYDVFFLSYQPGVKPGAKLSPIIRTGTISLINEDKTFYIDAAAFPGNSGSPVFLKPSPIRFDGQSISIGGDKLGGKFVGIIGEYIPYEEVAISTQTGRPRVVFEENTGLSRVWSVSFITTILQSNAFKGQLKRLVGD